MGGHAFGTVLGAAASFPRMDLATYERLRGYVTALLITRFSRVVVAREDPAKPDFGDLDVVVGAESYISEDHSTHVDFKEEILALLRAERAVSNGSHFISFAIAASTLDTHHLPDRTLDIGVEGGPSSESVVLDTPPLGSEQPADVVIYHQVDVNLAKDDDEMEAAPFYNSYGDLGMILALIFKTVGMSYSKHGLKVSAPYRQCIPYRSLCLFRSYTLRIPSESNDRST
jgi:hypothetical protein